MKNGGINRRLPTLPNLPTAGGGEDAPTPNPIYGTVPALDAMFDGDTLGDVVTWGTQGPEGVSVGYEMRLDGGAWVLYDGDTEGATGDLWRVRKIVVLDDFSRTYTSNEVTVQAVPLFPPINTVAPAITGTLEVGETLSVSNGTWDPAATSYNRRWTRNGTPISGATSSTYELVEDDEGHVIGAEVQGVNDDGSSAWAEATGGGEVQPIPPEYERTGFTATTRSIHDGHSLTDAYFNSGSYDVPVLRLLRDSLFDPDDGGDGVYLKDSIIYGSPISYRWDQNTPGRTDIEDFDALMITEAGPVSDLTDPDDRWTIDYSFDYFMRFCANTIENGGGNEVLLWSIWPYTDAGSFPDGLLRTGQYFETLAAYATFKMHDLYTLPEDWKVWLVPGHRWWKRVYDDLQTSDVPTITQLSDLFADTIHPDARADYGLACFVLTCLYQVDLREQTGVYIPAGFDANLREYFWKIAWEVATDYGLVGMNGTSVDGSQWDADTDPDFMPNWTFAAPDAAPGWIIMIDPDPVDVPENVTPPAFTGSLIDGETITLGNGGWTPTPDEFEKEIYADAVLESTNGSLDLTGREGEAITGRVRARLTGGDWSDWESATGGGEVQPATPPAAEVVVTSIGAAYSEGDGDAVNLSISPNIGAADSTKQVIAVVKAPLAAIVGGTFAGETTTTILTTTNPADENYNLHFVRAVLPSQAGVQTLTMSVESDWSEVSAEFFLVTGASPTLADINSANNEDVVNNEALPIDVVAGGAVIAGLASWHSDPWDLEGFTIDSTNGRRIGSWSQRVSGYRLQPSTGTDTVVRDGINDNIGNVAAVSLAPA